jgi:hypothetical protein
MIINSELLCKKKINKLISKQKSLNNKEIVKNEPKINNGKLENK